MVSLDSVYVYVILRGSVVFFHVEKNLAFVVVLS